MFNVPDPVKPGDLITAEQWNALIAKLVDLQERIETLEIYALRIEILELIFASPLRAGDAITILGRNFKTSVGTARVFIDGGEVNIAPGTFTDTRIDIHMPLEVNPPPNGKVVQLRVGNGKTDDTRRLTVLPRVVPITGEVAIQWLGVEPATIIPGASIIWRYSALSLANETATFTIQPVANPGSIVPPASQFEVLNSNRQVIQSKQLTLERGATQPTIFYLHVPRFPNVPVGTNFTLSVNFLLNGEIFSSSDPEVFQVGQPTTQPDNTITLTLAGVTPAGAFTAPNIIRPAASAVPVEVAIDAVFTVAGSYAVTFSAVSGFPIDRTAVPQSFSISTQDVQTAPDGRVSREIPITVGRPPAGTAEQTLIISLQRAGITQKQELTFVLRPS